MLGARTKAVKRGVGHSATLMGAFAGASSAGRKGWRRAMAAQQLLSGNSKTSQPVGDKPTIPITVSFAMRASLEFNLRYWPRYRCPIIFEP